MIEKLKSGWMKPSKKEAKNTSKKDKKKEKKQGFIGGRGFTHPFGYTETDGYLFVGQKSVISVFDVLIQYGTHNPAKVGWLLSVLPKEEVESGRVIFVQRQKGMEKEREREIIDNDISSNVVTIGEQSKEDKSAKARSQNSDRRRDLSIAGELSKNETIIDSDLRLIVKAKTPEDIESTIEELKRIYKNHDIKGIQFVRRTGEQLKEMQQLVSSVSADAWHNSDMLSVASGRLFLPSSGFSDPTGAFIGTDLSALLTNNPSIIDFSGVNNAVIFMGGVTAYGSIGGTEGASYFSNGGSAVAHVMSEANYLSGKRIHHIVLSEFNYYAPDSLVFDMTKEAINMLEVFGTMETVQRDAIANTNKVVTEMLLLTNTVNKETYAYMESELKEVLWDWLYYKANNTGLYTKDPVNEPNRARRILATSDHKSYPTAYDFLPALKTNVARRSREDKEARKIADLLYKNMSTSFNEFPNIFHKETTLPDVYKETDRNIYYDISGIKNNNNVASAVFLNVLAYVTNRALKGEQIVIHGLDQIKVPVKVITPYKERMREKNIGLITVFEKSESDVNPNTYSEFVGRLSRQDAVVLGGITKEELAYINDSWNQDLPSPVANFLMNGNDGALYFYRKRDRIGALVNTHLIL